MMMSLFRHQRWAVRAVDLVQPSTGFVVWQRPLVPLVVAHRTPHKLRFPWVLCGAFAYSCRVAAKSLSVHNRRCGDWIWVIKLRIVCLVGKIVLWNWICAVSDSRKTVSNVRSLISLVTDTTARLYSLWSLYICHGEKRVGQTLSTLTRFIYNISNICIFK